ncbi:non-ribosomal peptide synthase/polyketide synthase [Pseudomonas lundensis]|uniref:non-ribosomal peptide synthase/polyketide synthase n=1 Tax=Pseudomonas lundensis TaxID=86185 RepID=UPI001473C2B2|nr:non-ribosomal peptide synthase/polyketide synthase [Pseudomonas lundensis]NNA07928.1 non-ribosomal peptide synthase/polyketide synthase [Pseudomonas lundensis]
MNAEKSLKLARRFIELPLEKRRLFLDGLRGEGIDFSQFPIPKEVAQDDRHALSYAQRRMWFLWQLDPHSGAYNLPGAVRLKGELNVAALEQAFAHVVQRHETLRTVFRQNADDSLEQVALSQPLAVESMDFTLLPAVARDQAVAAQAQRQSLLPFDLANGPLLRIMLLKLADDEHVLLLTLHHIVSDGWSMNVLIDEFMRGYDAFERGQSPQLPELPIQYRDYALWQRRWLEAGEQARQLTYWRDRLGDEHPVIALPTDYPRPAMPSYRGTRHEFALDPALVEQLRTLAQRHSVTLFMLLLAAFNILLHRYSGQTDVRVGVPIANRNRREVEGLIGFFVNTQVLRCELNAQTPVADLLRMVKETALGAQAHQELPFEQLVEAFKLERNLSHNPLFQVMYNHQSQVADLETVKTASGLELGLIEWEARTTQFDLSLDTWEKGGRLNAALTYANDLFDAATITRMARHWSNLLRALVANTECRIGELPMLDASELHTQVYEWNHTAAAYPSDRSVHHLLQAQVARTPQACALVFGEQALSYAQLNARANQLARHLREQGVGPDVLVGIALERSLEMVIGLLAILKAGGAYVPLDPEYPQERLAYMIEDSGIDLLLTQQALVAGLPAADIRIIALDDPAQALHGYDDSNLNLSHDAQQLAYVIYTSGSTGRPKGAGNTHAALVNRLCWMQQAYGLDAHDTVLQKTPFSFDVSVWEFFWPLLAGARLVVAQPGEHREPLRLIDTIRQHQVSTLHFVPSMLQAFIHETGVQHCTSLRRIVCSGEALPVDAQQQVFAKLPGAQLYNLYGPTEAAIDVTHWTCVDEGAASVPIGLPIANLRTVVLDADLSPVAVGVAGELYLGGAGLARHYHRRPGLTAERFVPCPFHDGQRLYRTGDRVRQRVDGVIEYLGRLDHQVKLRGLRIELGEIEARLAEHADVREAVVLVLDGKQLVAYVVLQDPASAGDWQAALTAHLLRGLPEYMVPGHWISLEHLPLSPNGKLERKALPRPDPASAQQVYSAPATEREQRLAEIWQAVLGVAHIGVDDNFFALGGDSIISIQVVSRARQAGIAFSPRDLFQHQTIRSLARVAELSTHIALDQGIAHGPVALAPVQHGFFEQPMPSRHHWNQSLLLHPRQPVEAAPLEQALRQLLTHHDALRLRFEQRDGQWQQAYGELLAEPVLWQQQAASEDELNRLCELAQRSLDLQAGPLLRAMLIDMADHSQRVLLVVHHLAVDGVSWRVLLEDLQQFYAQPTQAPQAKTSAYQAWTAHLQAAAQARLPELAYWHAHLSGASSELPCDRAGGGLQNRHGQTRAFSLDAERTRQLLQVAPATYRTQVNDLLLTALARVICRWSGHTSSLIQLEGHGREELFDGLDLSRTVGWFTSLFPVQLTPAVGMGESIKAIKEQLRSVPDKGVGYGLLRYLAGSEAGAQLAALATPRITFNYLGQFDRQFDDQALFVPAAESAGQAQDEQAPLANWLSIEGQVYGGELNLQWTFSTEMFEPATIHALMDDYQRELSALIEHCVTHETGGMTPSDFPLARLTQQQLDTLKVAPGAIEDIYPLSPMQQGLLVHTLLEPGSGIYFMQDRYIIDSDIDLPRFTAAWHAVVQRHDALRASFSLDDDGNMLQIIHRDAAPKVQVHDWSDRPEAEHEAALQALLAQDRAEGFDLLNTPPFSLRLIRRSTGHYWFILSNHHILIDAWCRSLLLQDFFALYSGQRSLPPAARYRDFIQWLQEQGEREALAAWTRELTGFEQPTPLPFDRALRRQGGFSVIGDVYADLQVSQGRALRELAQRFQLTVNTLTQAAWALVLQRYSGLDEVLFGVTVAGRPVNRPEMQDTVGLFINSIPLRLQLPRAGQDVSVKAWLQRLFEHNLALREHEHLPLLKIQACSALDKGQSIFDSLFVYENAPVESAVVTGAEHISARSDSARTHTNYPMTVVVYPGDALGLHLSYDTRFFDDATAERLLADFKRLLLAIGEHADGPFAELPVVDAAEREHLLQAGNHTDRDYPLADGYVRLFEAQHDAHPEQVVATCLDQRWTYRELETRANRLGHALRAAGVGVDQPVALLAERSLALLGMMLGSFKAGAAYLPLDPQLPARRLLDLLQLGQVPVLVASAACGDQARALLAQLAPAQRPRLVVWEDVQAQDFSSARPGVYTGPDHLAYVIFTSGSTGTPKGVMVAQAGMLNNQLSKRPYLDLGRDAVIAQTASQSFDISVWQFLAAPLFGAQVDIVPSAIAHDPAALLGHVAARGISVLESVPSLIQSLLDEPLGQLPGLRWMLPTGEAMPPELARRWLQRYPDIGLVNAYGPAECSDDVALFRVNAASADSAYLPIGLATDNNRLYVLDGGLQPVPTGVVGELYVAGTGVGRGYFGDPLRTASVFLPNPYARQAGERLYRTGDLARRRADGQLEYVGRIDQQVKVRGFRIELGEIESRLRDVSDVREVAVVVQDGPTGKALVAFIVAQPSAPQWSTLREQLKTALKAQLPDYMVPLQWLPLDHLPLNANGKVDRKALPQAQAADWQRELVAPHAGIESRIVAIWQEVLKLDAVSRDDNFFELGGHSLLVAQVVSRVRQQLMIELPLSSLFETSVLSEFAARCQAQPPTLSAPTLKPMAQGQAGVLSYAQQRQWILWQLDPDSAAYTIPAALRLTGTLNRDALVRSFNDLQARHATLRTTFVQDGEQARGVVHASLPLDLRELTLAAPTQAEIQARVAEAMRQPFDLRHGPLLRVLLLTVGADEHVLVLTVHHIAADGWSMQIMVDEFSALYQAHVLEQVPELPALAVSYADFAVWQRDRLQAGEGERQLSAWKAHLGQQHPPLELPSELTRPAIRSERGARLELSVEPELAAGLRQLAQQHHVTLFMVLLASFQTVLHRYSGQSAINVGVPSAGRSHLETEGLIGFFINTHVLRAEIDGQQTFASLLQQVKSTALWAQAHQELPFEQLVEALQPERSLSHSPLFQVLFNHQRPIGESVERSLPGLVIRRMAWQQHTAQFDLALDTEEQGEHLHASLTYASDVYDAATVERLAQHWLNLLRAVVREPQQRIAALELMAPAEQQALIQQWNPQLEVQPVAPGLHQLFEAQAAAQPQAVAVRCGEQSLDYGELNACANRLARKLRELGVGPEVRVGIATERAIPLVVGVLAILKAGGAYVPLDPQYPAERLSYMIGDSGIRLLLTQEHLLESLPPHVGVQSLCLEHLTLDTFSAENLANLTRPDNLAYVIYTSGSTGRPKGALLSHANVTRLLSATQQSFGFDQHDVWTLFHSYAFDFSVWELFGALCSGGRLVIVPYFISREPHAFHQLLCDEGVTVLNQTPTAFRQLMPVACQSPQALALRWVIFGGEALEVASLRPWYERFGDRATTLVNMYGITETTVHVTFRALSPADLQANVQSPIGRPLSDLSWYLLDSQLQPVAPGCAGELYIAGQGLARGYHGRAGLSAERFVPSPFAPGERLYRSGDLARQRADGNIDYLGRIDQQVKIRGFRIELGEIEACLKQQPGVAEAVLTVHASGQDSQLCAYVVAIDTPTDPLAWREHLRAALKVDLPDYMVPSHWRLLDALPLTGNGKLDRKALPQPDADAEGWQRPYSAPVGTLETQLAAIWASVLDVERVGRHDNFFELGGHSLLAAQASARVELELGIELALRALFEAPDLQAYAAVAQAHTPADNDGRLSALESLLDEMEIN